MLLSSLLADGGDGLCGKGKFTTMGGANGLSDFRSDTVTRPTPGMRRAMAEAEVGDDVFGEDPTVNRLEERIAELLGKEAGLLVPSGSMSNLVAVRTLCRPGDEMICEAESHIFNNEQSAYAQICGVAARPVQGLRGILRLEQLFECIRPPGIHHARTRLLTLENTHNRGGGTIQPFDELTRICRWAHQSGLVTHLDGARLFNAVVATGIPASDWARHFDTVNICFSKGLGAPVGSALVATKELIAEARRHRKALGGGMRQAGILAAAALYALEHHIDRLAEDHALAKRLAAGIAEIPGLTLDPEVVETNMVFFRVDPAWGSASLLCERLKAEFGVLMLPSGPQRIRAVTHLDVGPQDVERALAALSQLMGAKVYPVGAARV
ncbi:MAG: beta-eliminating lyase-related protein [Thermoguttaceae bacterium]|nr:beta-eliminating lyase-related protein [Thermoguttaceae bacterium]